MDSTADVSALFLARIEKLETPEPLEAGEGTLLGTVDTSSDSDDPSAAGKRARRLRRRARAEEALASSSAGPSAGPAADQPKVSASESLYEEMVQKVLESPTFSEETRSRAAHEIPRISGKMRIVCATIIP